MTVSIKTLSIMKIVITVLISNTQNINTQFNDKHSQMTNTQITYSLMTNSLMTHTLMTNSQLTHTA